VIRSFEAQKKKMSSKCKIEGFNIHKYKEQTTAGETMVTFFLFLISKSSWEFGRPLEKRWGFFKIFFSAGL